MAEALGIEEPLLVERATPEEQLPLEEPRPNSRSKRLTILMTTRR
jgi:hypothetical protein